MTWGIYVHVPWCRRRCPYCAFYVEVDREVDWDRFVGALLDEHAWRRPAFEGAPVSVFLGGGTPSRMPAPALRRLLEGLPHGAHAEVAAECNPEDLSPEWLEAAQQAGVNRVSLGVQTFNPRFGRLLNRGHSAPQARQTARLLANAGLRSWSVDVMFALPGQGIGDVALDLDAILETDPPHVSLYGLTWEPGTPFERARDRGTFTPATDEAWRAMYDLAVERLEAGGLLRYEVSNFARPGHESVHNRLYWTDRPYLGLGPSAHGYAPDGARWVNVRDAAAYLAGGDPTATLERPDPEDAAADLLVSAMRGVHGLELDRLRLRARANLPPEATAPLEREGLIVREGGRIRLGDHAFPVADAVVRHLIERLRFD